MYINNTSVLFIDNSYNVNIEHGSLVIQNDNILQLQNKASIEMGAYAIIGTPDVIAPFVTPATTPTSQITLDAPSGYIQLSLPSILQPQGRLRFILNNTFIKNQYTRILTTPYVDGPFHLTVSIQTPQGGLSTGQVVIDILYNASNYDVNGSLVQAPSMPINSDIRIYFFIINSVQTHI